MKYGYKWTQGFGIAILATVLAIAIAIAKQVAKIATPKP